MIDLRPPPACSESYRQKIPLFSKKNLFFSQKKTLHHKFSSFKSSNNGKMLYLRILLVVYKQGSPQGGQCTIIISLMIARGRLNYWVLETRFRSSTKNVVRMPCDTEKNAREMPLRNSRILGTSRFTLFYTKKDRSIAHWNSGLCMCTCCTCTCMSRFCCPGARRFCPGATFFERAHFFSFF